MQESPVNRADLLREARFDVLRSAQVIADLNAGVPVTFAPKEIEDLLPPILRQTYLDDATFAQLAANAGNDLHLRLAPRNIVVSFPSLDPTPADRLSITDLAASSLAIWEICLNVKNVLEALDQSESIEPPQVTVMPGSTAFHFGGGTLLVSAVGLVMAVHSLLPAELATMTTVWGGSVLSMLGIVDRIFSWRKINAEAQKLRADARKADAETRRLDDERKANAEARKAEAEAQKAEAEARKAEHEARKAEADARRAEAEADSLCKAAQEKSRTRKQSTANSKPKPASGLLPQDRIDVEARARGIWPPLANHVINRVEPTVADVTSSYPQGITSTLASSAGRAASAS
jgi:hypothetical protein